MKQIITLLLLTFFFSNTIQAQCNLVMVTYAEDFTYYPCSDLGEASFTFHIIPDQNETFMGEVYIVNSVNTMDTIYPISSNVLYGASNYYFEIENTPVSVIPNTFDQATYDIHLSDYPECSYYFSPHVAYDENSPKIEKVSLGNTPVNTPILNANLSPPGNSPYFTYPNFTPINVPNHTIEHGTIVYNETNNTFDYYPTNDFQGQDYFYFWAEVDYNDFYNFEGLFEVRIDVGTPPAPDPADYGTYNAEVIDFNSESGYSEVVFNFYLDPTESYTVSFWGAGPFGLPTYNGAFGFSEVVLNANYYYYFNNDPLTLEEPMDITIQNVNDSTESYLFSISEIPFARNRFECSPSLEVDTISANAYTTTISFTAPDPFDPDMWQPNLWQPDLWRVCGTQEWNFNGTYDSLSQEFIVSPNPLEIVVPSDGWGYCFEFADYYDLGIYPYWETASSAYFNPQETPFTAKVFLEGPYAENETMSTDLGMLLPTTQPFGEAPYYYNGTESIAGLSGSDLEEVIDWVLVEARVGIPDDSEQKTQVIETQAGILLSDGSIVSTDLSSPLTFTALFGQEYHFCIRQRNHLDVLTSANITDLDFNYDLTLSDETAFGALQLKQMSDGKFAMYAGDFSSEGVIQTTDYDLWFELPAALNIYESTDANLDGVIQVTDYDIWFGNKAKIGTPEVRLD